VSRRSPSQLRVFWSRFVVAFVLCVVLAVGGIGWAYWFANDKWDSVRNASIDEKYFAEPQAGKPANYLIIGSDTRAFVTTAEQRDAFGDAGTQSGQRSDTMMIAHIDPKTHTGMLVSFPRDLWVNIPGKGPSKLNAAFNDGPEKVIETLNTDFDIPIHHYLEVDFAGFENLVDAVGGVPIYFPTPARDEHTGLEIRLPGCYEMDGKDALAYVRSRYYEYKPTKDSEWQQDGRADLGRILRQQYFIRSLAEVAINAAAKHPLKADNILNSAFESLTKDRNLGLSDMRGLAATMRETDPAVVDMLTVPSTPDKIQGQSVLVLDQAKAAPIFARLRSLGPAKKPLPVPKDVVPAQVKVKVLNGSGVARQAKSTLDALAAVGFVRVNPPDNADRSDYESTEVRYARGAQHKAQLVAAYLGVGKLVSGKTVAGADVTVVLGNDFRRVSTPTTTTSSTTTTTAKPTVTTGAPANPGRTPGVAPQPVVGCR
jgi:LCP family protein required for cell wall assembly